MPLDAKVVKFSEGGRLFLRAFLLDASKNANGWAVTPESIPKQVRSFVGMPLVLTQDYGHPAWFPEAGLVGNLQAQEKYRVGTITDIKEDAGIYDAIIEVTDPLAKEAIENNDVPFYVSPRIIRDPRDPMDAVTRWVGMHLAIVDQPAFGVDKAQIEDVCTGTEEKCRIALSAKKESCNFCVKTALMKLADAKVGRFATTTIPYTVTPTSTSTMSYFAGNTIVSNTAATTVSSQFNTNENSGKMGDTPPKDVPQVETVPRAEFDALKARLDALTVAAEDAKKAYQQEVDGIKEKARIKEIGAVLDAKITDEKLRAERLKFFTEQKTPSEVVATAYADMPVHNETQTFSGVPQSAKKTGWMNQYAAFERSLIKERGA